ncbi:hypothetical protein [Streptomyces sp. 8N706]|uniref:hypothetical protein n=1 Tax=Streptomyces sp. 8N706 TaxID=3457416 RepID=UPI003FD577FE
MPDISLTAWVLLCLAAAGAGWIDAVVGGGGQLRLPAGLGAGAAARGAYRLFRGPGVEVIFEKDYA